MPYKYRSLAPEERAAVVAERRSRGFPLHSPPHPFREEGYYLVTAAIYEHLPLLKAAARCSAFETQLLQTLTEEGITVFSWVILPDHYHVLLHTRSFDTLSHTLNLIHGRSSRQWNLEDGQSGKRKVWYSFYDRAVRSERHFETAINYIHYNPVKHGWVEDPYAWFWSSLENYVDSIGREGLREKWKRFPPGQFGKGWDD